MFEVNSSRKKKGKKSNKNSKRKRGDSGLPNSYREEVRSQRRGVEDRDRTASAPNAVGRSLSTAAGEARQKKKKLSSLQDRFLKKLQGAKFRKLNEDLYTTPGNASFQRFQKDPNLFIEYHEGFREQARAWPKNPLDMIIREVKEYPVTHLIGDFGCGDARLAQTVPQKTHSFDLVAVNPHVTACNVANVPLSKESLDIGVFCLALMGTDYQKFLLECHRVLKTGGALFIAEVESRFCPPGVSGGEGVDSSGKKHAHASEADAQRRNGILEAGIKRFLKMMAEIGFDVVKRYAKTPFFVLFKFKKSSRPRTKVISNPFKFKACLYKKR